MKQWLYKNREWVFSGVGVAMITMATSFLWQRGSYENDKSVDIPHSQKEEIVHIDRSVIQQNSEAGSNISAGRDLVINDVSRNNQIPSYEGEIGYSFREFIFENSGEVVRIDAFDSSSDYRDIDRNTNDGNVIHHIPMWSSCDLGRSQELPRWQRCSGTVLSIDRDNGQKDADFFFSHGYVRIEGYFAIKVCTGPHMGYTTCMLRPLNPEDILAR